MKGYLNTFLKFGEVLLFQMKHGNNYVIIDEFDNIINTREHYVPIEFEEARKMSKQSDINKNVFEIFRYIHLSIEKIENTKFRKLLDNLQKE